MNPQTLTTLKYLTPHEEAHLVGLLARFRETNLRNTTLLWFMLKTGARPQEVLNTTWADVDFTAKTVFIKTLKKGNDRTVPFKDDLLSRLIQLKPGSAGSGDKIFTITYRQFERIWREYRPVKKKLHSLRHTFAANLYRKSRYNLRLTQLLLGHRSMQTTAIYLELELDPQLARNAIS